jgi:hypothetical protein
LNTKEIISLVIAGCAGLVWAMLEIKRWKAGRKARQIEEENELKPNPARCADHESRLRGVEGVCHQIDPRLKAIETDLEEVKGDVKNLIKLHMKE